MLLETEKNAVIKSKINTILSLILLIFVFCDSSSTFALGFELPQDTLSPVYFGDGGGGGGTVVQESKPKDLKAAQKTSRNRNYFEKYVFLETDEEFKKAYKEHALFLMKSREKAITESQNTIKATVIIGYVIAIVVHLLLIIAISVALSEIKTSKLAASQVGQNEINLGLDGIAIKTKFIGVLLLGMAMIFYFLYLKYVYPITVIP